MWPRQIVLLHIRKIPVIRATVLMAALGFCLGNGIAVSAAEVTTLCRYLDPASGRPVLGAVLAEDHILPLQGTYSQFYGGQLSPHLESLPAFFSDGGKTGRALANQLAEEARQAGLPLVRPEEVRLLTPLDPVKLIAGSIFEGHAARAREAWARDLFPFQWAVAKMIGGGPFAPPKEHYQDVTYYQGNHLGWFPHLAEIQLPKGWESVDFEVEIAMLVVPDNGSHSIGGYFLFNDITHRKTQRLEIDKVKHGFSVSKHLNAAGWKFVLAEYVDFSKITAKASIIRADGEKQLLCTGQTGDALFSPTAVLTSIAARDGGLCSGEVITTGTLTGCCGLEILGAAEADLLHPGDTIRFESDLFGTLENRIAPRGDQPK